MSSLNSTTSGASPVSDEEQQRRNEILSDLFYKWDLDGNGSVSLGEFLQVIQAGERLDSKPQQKALKKLEAQLHQARRTNQSTGSMNALKLPTGGIVNFSDLNGEPSLDPEAFVGLFSNLVNKDSPESFDELHAFCLNAIEEASKSTHGSKIKKAIWEIFCTLDRNRDGFVDLDEIEPLLRVETKADRKKVIRWKHYLVNKELREVEDFARQAESDEDEYSLQVSLHDFHEFIHKMCENDENKIYELVSLVKKEVQQKQVSYICDMKIHEIMNEIMEDLLKEEPDDVLAGIQRSVERLKRTGNFPKVLKKRTRSTLSKRD